MLWVLCQYLQARIIFKIPVGIGPSIDISIAGEDTLSVEIRNRQLLIQKGKKDETALFDINTK